MVKGTFIHYIAIDPKLNIYVIEVTYGSFVWVHECPIASDVVYCYGGLDIEFRRYIKEYVASVHQRPHPAFGLNGGGYIASVRTYSFEDVLHQFFCILRQVINRNVHSSTVFALSRRLTYTRQTPFGKPGYD